MSKPEVNASPRGAEVSTGIAIAAAILGPPGTAAAAMVGALVGDRGHQTSLPARPENPANSPQADVLSLADGLPPFIAELNDAELRLLRDELRQIGRELKAAAELRRMVQEQIGTAFEEVATVS